MVKYLNMLTDWKKVYLLPFQSTLESKDREFQYKVLNRIVFTNEKFCCLGIVESPICAFCLEELESVEHFLKSFPALSPLSLEIRSVIINIINMLGI